jgi:hypothetical protein
MMLLWKWTLNTLKLKYWRNNLVKVKRSFIAKIAIGFREQYTQKMHTIEEAYDICREYTDKNGLCVTLTPTQFIYSKGAGISNGYEDGCFVELINYPRTPQSQYDIVYQAIDLAKVFLVKFNQNRISIITTDQTYLIDRNDVK